MQVKETPKNRRPGDGTPGPGRPKGVPNKATALLKDAILKAGQIAGGGGRVFFRLSLTCISFRFRHQVLRLYHAVGQQVRVSFGSLTPSWCRRLRPRWRTVFTSPPP
jgi:hypothetical protein